MKFFPGRDFLGREYEVSMTQWQREHDLADARAHRLLLEHLSDKQRLQLATRGCFRVWVRSRFGFKLPHTISVDRRRHSVRGPFGAHHCIHPDYRHEIPAYDTALGLMLLMRGKPRLYRKTRNVFK